MQDHSKQILLVDDDQDSCDMMKLLLEFDDYQVSYALTLAEGWRMAKSRHFDLCLLDTRLPDGNGYDLCRRIRILAPDLPIVFFSAEAYEKHRLRGLAAGAKAYLTKPNGLDHLAEVIGALIEDQKVNHTMGHEDNSASLT